MKTLVGIDFAHSGEIDASNPMGWRERYDGDWPTLARDWITDLSHDYDGLFVRFAAGACYRRNVGYKIATGSVKEEIVWTNAASDDMMSWEEHRRRIPIVAGLARTTTLLYFTGIPGKRGFPLALERIADLHVKHVGLDVSGRNLGLVACEFVTALRDLGITVYGEPLAFAHEVPEWMRDAPTVSHEGVIQAAITKGAAIPAGSYQWHNGKHPPTEEEYAQAEQHGMGLVLAAGLRQVEVEAE